MGSGGPWYREQRGDSDDSDRKYVLHGSVPFEDELGNPHVFGRQLRARDDELPQPIEWRRTRWREGRLEQGHRTLGRLVEQNVGVHAGKNAAISLTSEATPTISPDSIVLMAKRRSEISMSSYSARRVSTGLILEAARAGR